MDFTIDLSLNLFLSKSLFLFLHGSLVKPWCLLTKTPSIVILFLLVLCRIFLAILISKSYIFILAQLILDKLKSFMIIQCIVLTFESVVNFWNTVLDAIIMHHIISCHSSVHSVASWSGICRLTNGYVFEYHFVVFFGSYLIVAGAIRLPLLISLVAT